MMGLFDWFKPKPPPAIPEALWMETLSQRSFLAALGDPEKRRLKRLCEQFLATKEFSTTGGLILDDRLCVAIAAQGCLPVLELGLSAYQDWVGIVLYPNEFVVPRRLEDENGIVHEFDDVLAGEAWPGGPLLISWQDAQLSGNPDYPGYNVVIHEFAHKLDMLNGEADGIPALHSDLTVDAWERAFFPAYEDFCRRVDGGEDTAIDPYAAEAPEEFFAVLSECFFETPALVAGDYPALYALLRRYYRQDPLARRYPAS